MEICIGFIVKALPIVQYVIFAYNLNPNAILAFGLLATFATKVQRAAL